MWDTLLSWKGWLWPTLVLSLAVLAALGCHFVIVTVLSHFSGQ